MTDNDGTSDPTTLLITVSEPINGPPTDISLSPSSVAENQPSGTVVGTLSTVDPDVGDTHTYALVAGAGDTDNGSFTIVGNELQTNAVFDFETQDTYSVRVQTTDSGSLTFAKALTITVTDVNEAPSITSPAAVSVPENQTAAIDVAASDPEGETEGGGGLTYSFTTDSGGADNDLFALDAATGVVTFLSAPNFESPGDAGANNVYDVEVTVTDSGPLSDVQTIAITVTNVNEAPTDISLSSSSVAENEPSGTVVGTLSTVDPDVGDTHTYALVAGVG